MATANRCVALAPDYEEGYLLKGAALMQLGKKKEGKAALEKAKEMGSEQAQGLLDKYK